MDDEDLQKDAQSPLEEDNDTPFSEPDDTKDDLTEDELKDLDSGELDDTHPNSDSGIQPEEKYDEGLSGAAEAEEPNGDSAVVDMDVDNEEDEDDNV
ncbi:hypothetical protein H0V99_01920 [Candidatus Saccharibacteria bacterium]|nr:hypothetical protein [Candidatus Saccharibacteria bacterium]